MDKEQSRQYMTSKVNAEISIEQCINPYSSVGKLTGNESYKELAPGFLNHIRWLTGMENGISVADGEIRFTLTCGRHDFGYSVISFDVVFRKSDGRFMRICDILCKSDLTDKDSDRPLYYISQIKDCVELFTTRAKQLGFLKEAPRSHSDGASASSSNSNRAVGASAGSSNSTNAYSYSQSAGSYSGNYSTSTSGNIWVT